VKKTGFKVCLSNATCSATPGEKAVDWLTDSQWKNVKYLETDLQASLEGFTVGLCRFNQVDP
jgi:hypothetical protein